MCRGEQSFLDNVFEEMIFMIEQLSLKAKLALVAVVPIAVMLVLGVNGAWQKYSDYHQQTQAQSLVDLVVNLGDVAHELQKERGMSAGFISSKGEKFADALPAQRALSDKKIAALQLDIRRIDGSFVGPRYIKLLEASGGTFAELVSKRQKISQLALEAPESFRFYSDLIANLLEITVRTGNQMPSSKLSRLSNSKQALLYLKERNGQERALLTGGFSAGRLTSAQFNTYLGLLSDQSNFQRIIISYATPEQEKLLRDKLAHPVVKEIEAVEQMVKDKGPDADLVYSAEDWFAKISAKIDLLRSIEESYSTDIQKEIRANMDESRRALWVYLGGLAGALMLTLWFSMKIVRSLMRTIGGEPEYAAQMARRIAKGDLSGTVTLKPGDKLSLLAAMKEMQEGLREMVQQVAVATTELATSAQQLSSSSQQVMAATNRQSDAAASVAATVEEMTVSIGHISDNATDVHNSALESRERAQDGAKYAQETISEMNKIVENVHQSSAFMQTLDEQSHKIANIVNVIKEIADQTNLLALNAAIEAARAGEQGRGFAVVADEVRKLAERTKMSTEDIATMIEAIRSGTMKAVESMTHGTVMANEGMALVGRTGDSMVTIHGSTDKVLAAIDDVSTSLREQSCASNEIAKSVEGIALMVEENNSAINDVAVSVDHLRALSLALKESAARFRI